MSHTHKDIARLLSCTTKVLLKSFLVLSVCLFCGMGSALTQLVAWSTMLPDQLVKTGSVSEAVEATFDGKHACPLCKAAAELRAQEQPHDPAPTPAKKDKKNAAPHKLAFSLHTPTIKFSSTSTAIHWPSLDPLWSSIYLEISTPPPRA